MPKKINYITRPYKKGDEEKIVRVLVKIFHQWPKFDLQASGVDHWIWKYIDKTIDNNDVVVTEYKDQIIGVNHGLFTKIKIGKKVYLCQKGSDLGVDPDYRKMGVYSSLNKAKRKIIEASGIGLSYWLTSNPVLIKSYAKEDDALFFPNPIKYYVKIKNIDKHLEKQKRGINYKKRLFEKYGYLALKITNKIKNALRTRRIELKEEIEINQVHQFDEKIDEFWASIKNEYDFIVEKNQDYLNWRYCDPRGGNYFTWQAESKGKILGFMVLRINRINPDYPVGLIMEVIGLPNRIDIVERLISYAIDFFNKNDINIIHAQVVSGNSYVGPLTRNGFVDTKIKPYLYYRPYKVQEEDLELFRRTTGNRIHYQYGESDAI
jgi:predicted N-acetyltransferase YhbS